MSPDSEDTPAMMALRGMMREALMAGANPGEVMFKAVGRARRDRITDPQLSKVVEDLRAEGRL